MSSGGMLTGDWDKVANVLSTSGLQKTMSMAAKRAGLLAVAEIRKGIVAGAPGGKAFAPLSSITIARKGSSKPLIDNGDLVGSVTHEVVSPNKVWIGVKKGTRDKNGSEYVDIAAVHEYGCTIKVTPKMRAYLHHIGIHLKASTTVIHIPERSFLRATLNSADFRRKLRDLYISEIRGGILP